jgi:UDP-N-acetylglucosamine diphosphorylase / glucose-1-phosphate thymidylyltransferase / UDP-N-acetylgalactosamine diphosphorylase / glucosamine-1-phosphate N-acetyltransferase / galactosamine-1-phosphate N-acetyltransferase
VSEAEFIWPDYIQDAEKHLSFLVNQQPWQITSQSGAIITHLQSGLSSDYRIKDGIAIHSTAVLEPGVTIKAPAIIGPNCFIASHAYLRGGVYLMGNNSIGPGCEIKSSFLLPYTNLAHFNFIGDSILGSHVNFEAGSIIANHFNEREDKRITVLVGNKRVSTGVEKFGALVGDGCKIGANAVLSPGTVLLPSTVVKRLALIEQDPL